MSARVLVLLCPDWPVVAACAENSEVSFESPVALSHAGVITHTSPAARRRGVTEGRRLRDAQASAVDLVVLAHDVEREQRVWNQVLQALRDTVARIAVIEPGTLALRAAGLARYYGSEQRATEVLLEVLAAMDWIPVVRIGIADTLFTATQAARHGTNPQRPTVIVPEGADRDVLAPLPLGVLDNPDLVATLQALGLSTLADFAALDAQQVSQRFGTAAALLHTCAQGLDPRQASSIDIPPSTDRIWRSDQPLSRADELSFALRATVDHFLAGLTAVHVVCTTVRITLVDDRGESHSQVWSHPRFFSAVDIVNRVRWQWESLARHSVEEYQEGGVAEVHLQALSPDNLFGHEPGLWGGAEVNSRVEHSIARLQSSLGHDAVARAELQPGHDFDEREVLVPWGSATPTATIPLDGKALPTSFVGEIPRPLPATVFHPPTPVELTDSSGLGLAVDREGAVLRGQPALLHSGQATRSVVAWAGPWPVIERWWDPQASRRRYRLQLLDQEGVGWLVSHDPTIGQWQVEARYD